MLILLCHYADGQDISGTWRGNYGKSFLNTSTQRLEVDIELYNDSLIKGSSHLYYGNNRYEHYNIAGVFNKMDSTIYFNEVSEISVDLGGFGNNVMGNYAMTLRISGNLMKMEGKWEQNKSMIRVMATKVWLEKSLPKKPDTIKTTTKVIVGDKQNTGTPKPVSNKELKQQPVRIVKIIEIDSAHQDSIRIEITDNARIDNDIISVYIDDELVINNQAISRTPLVIDLRLSKTKPQLTIRMKAESYGSMPPCTARMSIITPGTSYIADVESNYTTTGAIVIKLKE